MVVLRHRLPGSWLRSIEGRFEGPEISIAHNLAERFQFLRMQLLTSAQASPTPAAHSPGAIANTENAAHEVAGG